MNIVFTYSIGLIAFLIDQNGFSQKNQYLYGKEIELSLDRERKRQEVIKTIKKMGLPDPSENLINALVDLNDKEELASKNGYHEC